MALPRLSIHNVAEDLADFVCGEIPGGRGVRRDDMFDELRIAASRDHLFDRDREMCVALDAVTDAECALAAAKHQAIRTALGKHRNLVANWIVRNEVERTWLRAIGDVLMLAGLYTEERWIEMQVEALADNTGEAELARLARDARVPCGCEERLGYQCAECDDDGMRPARDSEAA